MNNTLSVSRMNTLLRCMRAHYWKYEIGLIKETDSLALKIGSAWARAMEARWNGLGYKASLSKAIPKGVKLGAYDCATVASLLIGYFTYYGKIETFGKLYPECEFDYPLDGSDTFRVVGRLDGLGVLHDERAAIIEAKTTSASVDPNSNFWLRLRFNMQVFQYVCAARKSGWDISHAVYDVTRKPSIRPKTIDIRDKNGLKIVLNQDGVRAIKKNGQPRESGSVKGGLVTQSRLESPEEFGDRLVEDISARPDFYFVRKEVAILDGDVAEFEAQRLSIARMILDCRKSEFYYGPRPFQAWPRAVSENNCQWCEYSGFCLQNITLNLRQLPPGYSVKFNPELTEKK